MFNLLRRLSYLVATLVAFATPAAATLVSAPFTLGFIGTKGANTQQANNIKLFTTLGIARAYLQQNTDNGRYGGTQGNDYAATLKLVLNNGTTISIDGNITWRDGANPLHGVGFIPLGTVTTQTITYGSSQTYTLNTTSNYLVQLNTSSKVYTDGSNVSGNAANSGIFTELNAYLDTTLSSRPAGPVTVTAQDTYDTTPTVTGTMTLAATDDLTVEINGVVYTTSNGLTLDRIAGTWSVTIPNGSALPVATYPVTATIINQSGYILTDSTTNELRVLTPVAAMTLVKTASVSGDTVTYTYRVTNSGALDIHSVSLNESAGNFTGTGTAPTPAIDNAATGTADDDSVLGVGEVWTYTATYTVTQADRDAGGVSNRASVSGLNPSNAAVSDVSDNGNEAADADSDGQTGNDPTVTALTRSPAMTLVKTSSVSGNTVSYTYVVTNTGNVTLTTVALSESALGFTGTGTRPTPVIDGTATGTADDDNELDVGESWTYSASYTLTQADKDAGSVSNSATATARDPSNTLVSDVSDNGDEAVDANSDSNPGNDPTVTTLTQSPAMTLVKTASFSGRTITYTYAATNSGNVTLHGVSLNESGTDFSGTGTLPSPSIDATATGTADDDSELDVGETWTWTATYTLTDADFSAGTVSNSATVSASDPNNAPVSDMSDDGNPADSPADPDSDGDNDPTETTLVMAPELTLVKTASLTVSGLTYRYAVTNTGNVGLHNLAINESAGDFTGTGTLPSPAIDATATGTADDDGVLDVGETWVFTADYTATGGDRTAGSVTNSATATADDLNNNPVSDVSDNGDALDGDNNPTITSLTGSPELTLVKTGTVSGGVLHYHYDVTNTGNVSLTTVAVLESAGDFSGTGTLPVATIDDAETGIADDDSALDPGETWVFTADYTLTQADIDAGSVTNSATATAKDPSLADVSDVSDDGNTADSPLDPDSDGDNDPTETSITANPALRLTKTAAASGDDLVYTYVVTNTGNVTLTNVGITESAGDFTGTGTLPSPSIDAATTGTADDDGELDVGESWTYTATYSPTDADRDAGTISNSATADATDPSNGNVSDVSDDGNEAVDADNDGQPGNDPTEATVPTTASLSITHENTDLIRRFTSEYRAVFQITLTNDGNVTLHSVSLLNDLAAYVGGANLVGTPSITKVSGPGGVSLNNSFDGNTVTALLTGETLSPGQSVVIEVAFNFLTTSGFPAGGNTATGNATELAQAVDDSDDLGVTDDDGDGAVDTTESSVADRDGDGIADADDYDPTGYFYCEDDGRILTGGSISISKAGGGSNSSVGTANNITIAQDGSGGYYQWWVDAPGTYTMAITYPAGTTPSTTRTVNGATLDVTSLLPSDPAFIGSTEFGSTGYLADFTLGANPTFYTVFDIQAGDPNVMANNIPVTDCASAAGSIVVNDRDLTTGEETDDTAKMGFALSSAPLSPVTLTFRGDAQCRVEPATMTFTAADWATEQRLTIIGRKDNRKEGAHSCTPTVIASSTDPAYDGLAPALSDVTVADSLIDVVEERVREQLEEDLTRTLKERSAEFRDISAKAAIRLGEPIPEFCGKDQGLNPDGSILGENGSLRVDGTLNSEGNACLREGRVIVQSRFALVRNAAGSSSADISGDILRETRQSDSRLSGRFIGGYLRLPADQDGADNIRAIGLHAGLYGAEKRGNGWATDHYLALGIGLHSYDFTFGTSAPIHAKGDYRYAALYGGVALSREIRGDRYVLTPRIGVDLALGLPTDASITARQGRLREDGTITLDPMATARLYVEMGIALPDEPQQPGMADTDWSLTPSIFCDVATSDESACGVGLALDLERVSADRNLAWGVQAKLEHSALADTLALTLRHVRQLEGVDGQVATTLGVGPNGDPTASQTVNLRF